MTGLEIINKFFLQWLGIRLARWGESADQAEGEPFVQRGWSLIVGVLPLSGWGYSGFLHDYIGPVWHVGPIWTFAEFR